MVPRAPRHTPSHPSGKQLVSVAGQSASGEAVGLSVSPKVGESDVIAVGNSVLSVGNGVSNVGWKVSFVGYGDMVGWRKKQIRDEKLGDV